MLARRVLSGPWIATLLRQYRRYDPFTQLPYNRESNTLHRYKTMSPRQDDIPSTQGATLLASATTCCGGLLLSLGYHSTGPPSCATTMSRIVPVGCAVVSVCATSRASAWRSALSGMAIEATP